jgi:AraC family transcriptional regulator
MVPIPTLVDRKVFFLAGQRIQTTLFSIGTPALWRAFKPRVREFCQPGPRDFYSVRIYPDGMPMSQLTPATVYEEWAAVEVGDSIEIPEGVERLAVPDGKYAVFTIRGGVEEFTAVAREIYVSWLPDSGHIADDRPHFSVMGEKYIHGDPMSEEELWVPIK